MSEMRNRDVAADVRVPTVLGMTNYALGNWLETKPYQD